MVTKKPLPIIDFADTPSELPAKSPVEAKPVAEAVVEEVANKPKRAKKAKSSGDQGEVFKTVVIKLTRSEYQLARKMQLIIEDDTPATSLAMIAKIEFLKLAKRKVEQNV